MSNPPFISPEDLAKRAARDDRAWESFITSEYAFVYWFPTRVGRNPHGRQWDESTLAEWFGWVAMRLRPAIESYDGRREASFRTFFHKVLQNKFRDWLDYVRVRQRRGSSERRLEDLSEADECARQDDPVQKILAEEQLRKMMSRMSTLPWLARMSLLVPDFLDKVGDADLSELARNLGLEREVAEARILEICDRYENDSDIVDLLIPPESDGDRTDAGKARRLNRLQKARSRARRFLEGDAATFT